MKKLLLLWVVLGFVSKGLAQVNNRVLADEIPILAADSGKFFFNVKTNSYFRNTEYFNPIELGRTLLGYQVQPLLAYQLNAFVKIQTGLYARRDFGASEVFTDLQPVFSIKAEKGVFSMVFGTLEGALTHGFLEPIFDINRYIEHRNEEGIQFKIQSQQSFVDLFIDWNRYISRSSNEQEKFVVGLHAKHNLLPKEKSFKIIPDVQIIGKHHGGQIGSNNDPVTMRWNTALGLRFEHALNTHSAFFDVNYLSYAEPDGSGLWPFKNGIAYLSNLGIQKGAWTISSSLYWGNQFLAPIGTPIYASQSIEDPKLTVKERKLCYLRLVFEKPLMKSQIKTSFRLEPVYDLNKALLDYSYSLYLVYNFSHKLSK